MSGPLQPADVLGLTFLCQFRIAEVHEAEAGDPNERVVVLYMYGERAVISWGELANMIESGFVVPVPWRGAAGGG